MQQPALIEVLREEVDQFGDANIDYDSYKSLSQIMAVFNEGLRVSLSFASPSRSPTDAFVPQSFTLPVNLVVSSV